MSRLPRNTDAKFIRHISIRTEKAVPRLLPTVLAVLRGGTLTHRDERFPNTQGANAITCREPGFG